MLTVYMSRDTHTHRGGERSSLSTRAQLFEGMWRRCRHGIVDESCRRHHSTGSSQKSRNSIRAKSLSTFAVAIHVAAESLSKYGRDFCLTSADLHFPRRWLQLRISYGLDSQFLPAAPTTVRCFMALTQLSKFRRARSAAFLRSLARSCWLKQVDHVPYVTANRGPVRDPQLAWMNIAL